MSVKIDPSHRGFYQTWTCPVDSPHPDPVLNPNLTRMLHSRKQKQKQNVTYIYNPPPSTPSAHVILPTLAMRSRKGMSCHVSCMTYGYLSLTPTIYEEAPPPRHKYPHRAKSESFMIVSLPHPSTTALRFHSLPSDEVRTYVQHLTAPQIPTRAFPTCVRSTDQQRNSSITCVLPPFPCHYCGNAPSSTRFRDELPTCTTFG